MVQQEIKFSDGTRIFYEEDNGILHRYIEYAYTQKDKELIKNKPLAKNVIASKVRKYNASKYYYLDVLYGIKSNLDESQRNNLYDELQKLHDKVGSKYDKSILNTGFLNVFGKYWPDNRVQCAAFFTTIYLAMLDLEASKEQFPHSHGKTMVLRSCEAVILQNKNPKDAAVMFERKIEDVSDDAYYNTEVYSRYEKYNGYNGFDDDTIDGAFDGFPEATWNVD